MKDRLDAAAVDAAGQEGKPSKPRDAQVVLGWQHLIGLAINGAIFLIALAMVTQCACKSCLW